VPVQANDVEAPTPIDVKCQCSDADPRVEATQSITYTCLYQRHYGNCDQTYMFDANAELSRQRDSARSRATGARAASQRTTWRHSLAPLASSRRACREIDCIQAAWLCLGSA
jgi:hypothetical protein